MKKTFEYKVFDSSGTFLKTWTDVVSEPTPTEEINSPATELVVRLSRKATDFGEEEDIKFNNRVKVYIKDLEYSTPTLWFNGYIANYSPVFEDPEYVEVILYSFGAELSGYIYGADEVADQSQATGSSTSTFGSPSTTLAQSFIPAVTPITSVELKLAVTEPTNVTLSIQTDATGSPSGSSLGSVVKEITDTSATVNRFIFGSSVTVTPGSTYWLVLAA